MSAETIWTPERLIRYPAITDLHLSEDGAQVAYTVRQPLLSDEESRYITHICRVSADGGEPQRLTFGRATNEQPRWSPDGRYLAFLSDRDKGVKNLYVLRADGGEAWAVTAAEKNVQTYAWSPDGSRLAFIMVPADTEERKKRRKAKDDPILWDVEHERAQLWVVSAAPAGAEPRAPRALTGDDRHVLTAVWAEDGRRIAYVHQPTPCDNDWPETRLAVVRLADDDEGEPETRELAHVAAWSPTLATRGDMVACPTGVRPVRWTGEDQVVLYPLDGGEPQPLALTEEARPNIVGWAADESAIYVLEFAGLSSAIRALPTDGGAPQTVIEGQGFLSLASADRHNRLAFVFQDVDRPNAVVLLRAGEGEWRTLAEPAAADWPALEAEPRTQALRWTADDGLEIEGLLTLPREAPPEEGYPTLVVVHGGPAGVYSRSYVSTPSPYPLSTFAERGYALLRVNPRGSSGYGAAFRAANRRDWGGSDYRDIMAGVDRLVERGLADPQLLGIMGWSYGGYMTSWTITQTDRFHAASVGAGVTNLMSFNGTADIPTFIPDYFEAEFWDDPTLYQQRSALFNAKGVGTPTLIQHGEADVRVPLSQGHELYNALKRQGVPTQLVIYPRQGHGPDEPRLLVDLMARNLEWFDRWLSCNEAG